MPPHLVSFGLFQVNLYTLLIGVAGVAGVVYARHCAGATWSQALNLHVVAAAAALIAGRIGYVFTNAGYFMEHARAALDFANAPGLQAQAALLGAVVVGLLLRMPRAAIVTICLVGIGASIGCVPNGCGYGREVFWTGNPLLWLLRVDWPDVMLVRNPRLPTQLFTVAWLMVCLIAALRLRRPVWAIVMIAAGDWLIGFLRAG